jgi:hypothetical protein
MWIKASESETGRRNVASYREMKFLLPLAVLLAGVPAAAQLRWFEPLVQLKAISPTDRLSTANDPDEQR